MVKIETLQQYAQIASPIITAITLIFVIINVNRSQQKSKLNDEEKFRRDLNLKASDEMIAAISSLRRKSGYYFTQKDIRNNIKDEITLNNFVRHVSESAEVVEDAGLELQKIYNQRKIIMKEYDNDMDSILNDCFSLSDNLLKIKTWYTTEIGHTDQEIQRIEKLIIHLNLSVFEKANDLQKKIQNDFIGKLYNKRI
ncbi:hypothetical protein [Paenibacillus chitinolyticus]|uniref:hypothetical protein n=1 Tax=Paenibacillus chitinolyticus TaxID=79263 RepID=UPI003670C381